MARYRVMEKGKREKTEEKEGQGCPTVKAADDG
jgi:hypothetical protein